MSGQPGAYLREVADDDLYRRNAFRVTGVPTGAGARSVRERQKKAAAAAAVGVAVAPDERLPLTAPPSDDEVRSAYEVLADPGRRLVHEMFWFWGDDVDACGCDPVSHRAHDKAVDAHARALDAELAGARGETWRTARKRWSTVLADPRTWAHLRARVAALGDARRLDDGAVDELRRELPRALAATVVSCAAHSTWPGRLRESAERWPVDPADLDDLLLGAVAGRVARVESRLTEARRLIDGTPLAATRLLRPSVVEDLGWIQSLAPSERLRSMSTLRDDAAIVLNNAALGVVERGGTADRDEAVAAYDDAIGLATTTGTRTAITDNREAARNAPDPAVVARYEELTEALRREQFTQASALATELLGMVTDREERAELHEIARKAAELAGTTPRAAARAAGTPRAPAMSVLIGGLVATIFGLLSLVIVDSIWLSVVAVVLSTFLGGALLRRAANRDLDRR